MRKGPGFWFIVAVVCLSLIIPPAWSLARDGAHVVTLALFFAEPSVESAADGYARVGVSDLPRLGVPGEPALPYRVVRLLLPPAGAVQQIIVAAVDERWLPGRLVPEPARPQIPISAGIAPPDVTPAARIYAQGRVWPAERYRILSEQYLDGYRVLLMQVFPVRYDAARQACSFAARLYVRVQIEGASAGQSPAAAPAGVRQRVAASVDNPQDVARFGPRAIRRARSVTSLVDPDQPCDYIIVTSRGLREAFEPLIAHRRAQGLRVEVFLIEDILRAYDGTRPSGGSDDAARLRNFLSDAYTAWANSAYPLRYVLLGGDTEIIPVRNVFVRAGIYETEDAQPLVSDSYYAGLDGTWDDDRDGLYGEGDEAQGGTGAAGEEADLLAELYVGRAPVNERQTEPVDEEARNWVAKVLAYEGTPQAAYLNDALWLGERLDDTTYGDDSKELILSVAQGLQVKRLYDSIARWGASDLRPLMNANVHIVNHLGHANAAFVLRMMAGDVESLTNAYPFLVFSQGCLAAAISVPSSEAIAERFVTARAGAFAFIGNTNYGWYLPNSTNGASQVFDMEFFRSLYQKGIVNLGRALQDAKESALGQVGAVGPERWVYLELILLGDPYTPIATAYAEPVARLTAPSRTERAGGPLFVRGSARAGALPDSTFGGYRLYWGMSHLPSSQPSAWTPIGVTATIPVSDGILGAWDVGLLQDSSPVTRTYRLRLVSDDGRGLQSVDELVVQVDHAHLAAPAANSYLRASGVLSIQGIATRGDFVRYMLDYGSGANPAAWTPITTSQTPVLSGTLALWDTSDIVRAGLYTLRLRVEGANYYGEDRLSLNLDPFYEVGWPRAVANRISNESLAVGDLDGDGLMEVVATEGMRNCGGALEGGRCGAYGMLVYVWDAQGRLLPGWPKMPGSDNRLTAPALADLDGDGTLEILVGSIDGAVYAYRYDGVLVAGWPQKTGGAIYGAPACADLDGDRQPDVVACNELGQVHAWRGDGSPLPGWPQRAGGAASTALLADLDRNGVAEVIVADSSGRVSAWRGDGSTLPEWPVVTAARFMAAPVAGDLDNDGYVEVVAPANDGVYVWRGNGSPLPGWPARDTRGNSGSSPALADLDGDGHLEIIFATSRGGLEVWRYTGERMGGWIHDSAPVTRSSPVVGDMDGDGDLEIIVVSDDVNREVYAYHHDGAPVAGWPRTIPRREEPQPSWDRLTSATLCDLDSDGRLELGVGVERYVFFWALDAPAQANVPWPTFHGNMQRAGALTPPPRQQYHLPLLLATKP